MYNNCGKSYYSTYPRPTSTHFSKLEINLPSTLRMVAGKFISFTSSCIKQKLELRFQILYLGFILDYKQLCFINILSKIINNGTSLLKHFHIFLICQHPVHLI